MILDKKKFNANGINGEDSKRECMELFNKREYYISGDDFLFSPVHDTMEWLLKAATSGLNHLK